MGSTKQEEHNKELMEYLKDASPGMWELWNLQAESCYCAFLAGKGAAKHMVEDGFILPEQETEYAMEFAKVLAMKVTLTPRPQPPPGGIVVPNMTVLPGNVN